MPSTLQLRIDPAMGMAGDMFAAALIGLGVPQDYLLGVMTRSARLLGHAEIQVETLPTPEGPGHRLKITLAPHQETLSGTQAQAWLEQAIAQESLQKPYAAFARRALAILIQAEREAHSSGRLDFGQMLWQPIGIAHTPYAHHHARQPLQPRPHDQLHPPSPERLVPFQASHHSQDQGEDTCYVELFPEFAAGLKDVETFSHVFILSWLHHSSGYTLEVTPPWQKGEKRRVGVFASRSPRRPNPIGLTLTEVRGVEGNRLLTGPLDLFDGTPIIDIKPHIRSLDRTGLGDDGWLAESDHLALHRAGIPHSHPGEDAALHEAQDIVLDIMAAAAGLQYLQVDMQQVGCFSPVAVGGGMIRFSHGVLPAPAPATQAILRHYRVPHVAGPVDVELLTPTGAALLAALHPVWLCRHAPQDADLLARGLGLGTRNLRPLNALRLALVRE